MRISIFDWSAIEPIPSDSATHPTKLRSTVAFEVDGEPVEVATERNGKPLAADRQFADLSLTVAQSDALSDILADRALFRAAVESGTIDLPGGNGRGKPPVRGTSLADLLDEAEAEAAAEAEAEAAAKKAAKAAK